MHYNEREHENFNDSVTIEIDNYCKNSLIDWLAPSHRYQASALK